MKEITVTKLVCEEEESFTASAEKENIILQILEPGEVAVKEISIALIISLLETYPDDADEADIALAKQAVAELKTLLGGP